VGASRAQDRGRRARTRPSADRGTVPQPLGPKAGRPLTPPRLELGRRDQGPI